MALLINGAISAAGAMTPEEESLGKMNDETLPQQSAAGLMTHEELLGKINDETLTLQIVLKELLSALEYSEPGTLDLLLSTTIPEEARPTPEHLKATLASAVLSASAPADQILLDKAQRFVDGFLLLISDDADQRAAIIDGAFIRATQMINERAVDYFITRLRPRPQAADEAYRALQSPVITEQEEAYRMFGGFTKPIEECRKNILGLLAPTAK